MTVIVSHVEGMDNRRITRSGLEINFKEWDVQDDAE
jgi:hypothetical protein